MSVSTDPEVAASERLSWRRDFLVFLGFASISFGYFGAPLVRHPGRVILGTGADNEIFVWAFAWWPHALLNGTNPFVTHALYAPTGANLAWITSVPGLALAASPLTLIFGPVVAFNVVALLLPALAAWTAFRLCFVLTRSLWASLVGGYLFGFSSFVLAQQITGHIFLTATFVLPLIALAIVRFARGELSRRRFAVRFGALIALQLSISTEVALTLTAILALSVVLARVLVRDARPMLGSLVPSLAAGYCLGAVFAAPLVIYALLGFPDHGFIRDPTGTDLMNLVFPTEVNAVAGSSFPSVAAHFDPHDDAIFIGAPALLIVALYAWRTWRSGWTRFLTLALATSVLLALGPKLSVDGHRIAPLPWALFEHLPGFEDVLTRRFAEYTSLALTVIVALWTARTPGRVFPRPYALPLLAVAALVPAVWHPVAVLHPTRPTFFTTGLYKTCIPGNETLAIFPITSANANVLQAETGFSFRVAGGYLTPVIFGAPPVVGFLNDPTVYELNFYGDRGVPTVDALRAFAYRHGVDRFVSFVADGSPTKMQMRTFGSVQRVGDVYVTPGCGQPSLTNSALPAGAQRTLTEQRDGTTIRHCLHGYIYDLPAGLRPAALLQGATRAVFIAGRGLLCSVPPGYTRSGLAPGRRGIPSNTYAYYTR